MVKAILYLSASSFNKPHVDDFSEFCSHVEELFLTVEHMKKHKERFPKDPDEIMVSSEIYHEKICGEYTFCDLAYNSKSITTLSRDSKRALQLLVDRNKKIDLDDLAILTNIRISSKILQGLLCLKDTSIDDEINKSLVNSIDCWYKLHRRYLEQYCDTELQFYEEIVMYYEKLFIHPRVEKSLNTIEGGLQKFLKNLSFNLTQLNDRFKDYNPSEANLRAILHQFSADCGVDATLEGNCKRKKDFTFDFTDPESNQTYSVCCEPHLKLTNSDLPGDTKFYYNRIYFHQGLTSIQGGRILVGHIGKHL